MFKILQNSFFKAVSTLTIGSLISQLIPLALSPVLARIFTPEDFGLFAIFFALTSIFGVSIAGKYDISTLIPRKDSDAINLTIISFFLSLIGSVLLLICILLFWIFNKDNTFFTNSYYIWIIGLPVAVLFTGIFNTLSFINTRFENYSDIAQAKIYKSIALSFSQIILGLYSFGMVGLSTGLIISNIFANIKLVKNIFKKSFTSTEISTKRIKELMIEYKVYPLYLNPASLLDIATLQMPLLFIIKIAGDTINGHFFFASRIISIPSTLIGKAISQVFFQKITNLKSNNKKCIPLFTTTARTLFLIALPISMILFLISPIMFEFIFGKVWIEAGLIAQYLSLIFLIQFPVSALSNILSLKEFVKRATAWKILYFSSSLILYLITITLNLDFYLFLKLYVIHEYFLYSIYMILIVKSVLQIDRGI